jgi:hydroxyacylglutathione hydrolase
MKEEQEAVGMISYVTKSSGYRRLILNCCVMAFLSTASAQIPGDASAGTGYGWFEISQVTERVWRIDDHGLDNIYLVEGEEKALLIDTGNGVADLAGTVQNFTDKPLIIVNTHGHPDHVGGNFQYSEVYAHPKDFDLIRFFAGRENHTENLKRLMEAHPDLQSFFFQDIQPYKLPVLKPVESGFMFDLGGRKLEVIEVPGHTKGSIVLLDSQNRLLFTGDNNNTLVWLFLDGCLPIEAYLGTLQKLNARSNEFDKILPGHGGVIDKSFIGEQIICAQQIISGECQGEKYESFAGPALLCRYKRAAIAYDPENVFTKR